MRRSYHDAWAGRGDCGPGSALYFDSMGRTALLEPLRDSEGRRDCPPKLVKRPPVSRLSSIAFRAYT